MAIQIELRGIDFHGVYENIEQVRDDAEFLAFKISEKILDIRDRVIRKEMTTDEGTFQIDNAAIFTGKLKKKVRRSEDLSPEEKDHSLAALDEIFDFTTFESQKVYEYVEKKSSFQVMKEVLSQSIDNISSVVCAIINLIIKLFYLLIPVQILRNRLSN